MKNNSNPLGVILAPNGSPARILAAENNWYEASRWSANRSYIWFPVQDAKKDLDRFTRLELAKNARYLYKNSPLIRGIIERLVTLTVGSGFHPNFKSSNPLWNQRARMWWKKRSVNIHLGHRCSNAQYQRAVVRAGFLDGECFTLKTYDTTSYKDCVQGLECDRVAGTKSKDRTPQQNAQEFTSGGVDGFNLNEQGTILSYNVKGVTDPILAENIVQHYTPMRLGQYRGETILAAALNTARDVDDILALEKQCVKEASGKKDIIKTATGQLDPETMRSLRYGQAFPTVFSLPPDDNAKNDYYKVAFGAESVVMKKGDEYTPYKSERAGPAWQGFMDFLRDTICMSTGLPISTIVPISVGGTDIRRDLDIAQKVVDPWQMDRLIEFSEILSYLLEGEVADGELKQGCPSDYSVITWQCPAKVNVDRGQAQQDREDVMHGLMSWEEYHQRYGDDGEEVEDTVIQEAKRRRDKISASGFKDLKEFVQILSLDSKMFQSNQDSKEKESKAA